MRTTLCICALIGCRIYAAPSVYIPVYAPAAQALVAATQKAHPELQKLGLHAVAPGQTDLAIIANTFPSKVGKKSSEPDLQVAHSGQPSVKRDEKGKFFDLCLPIGDATGRTFGLTVMEIPYRFAKDNDEALAKASAVRDEMTRKIPRLQSLFEDSSAPLVKSDAIALGPDIKGHFDHLAVDLTHNRLFSTAEGAGAVLVHDLVTSALVTEIRGIGKPHAIFYRPESDRIYVTDGDAGSLRIFDGRSYAPLLTVPLAKDADSMGYDASLRRLYVVSGGKEAGQTFSLLSVINVEDGSKVAEIHVEGETLEAMALDLWRPRMYVNNKARNQIEVVDRFQNKVVGTWPVKLGKDNVAMALDEAHQRLFVGCRSGNVVVFDTNTGKEIMALKISEGVDDMVFDVASKRLYAVGNGNIDVYEETDADHFRSLGTVSAGGPARTGLLVPEVNRYYAAIPADKGSSALIGIFEPMNVPATRLAAEISVAAVNAPFALELDRATMSAHPDLRKMGIHGVPPGANQSVILANFNTSRIGVKSSSGDLEAMQSGQTSCVRRDDGSFYNMKLPLKDAKGKVIGILVMEVPYTSAGSEAAAIEEAEKIRSELAARIPSYDRLFQ